jgi:lipoprotein-anchoring transpeptidase ErfK/SrfK
MMVSKKPNTKLLSPLLSAIIISLLGVHTSPANTNNPPSPQKTIQVHLETQTLVALEHEKEVFRFPCSTGKNSGTPPGKWPIKEKVRYNRSLPQYGSIPIPFSLRLDITYLGRKPRIAIHAHKNIPRYPASHGCIRLSHSDAEKLFGWAEVGVPVEIK